MQKSTKQIQRFINCTSGSFLPIFGVCAIPFFIAVGVAFDYTRVVRLETQLQNAADIAVLAAANQLHDGTAKETAENFFDSNYDASNSKFILTSRDIEIGQTTAARTVTMSVTGQMKGAFTKIWSPDDVTINVVATATQAIPLLEVAMALDISASMNGSKFVNLKSATKEFVTNLFEGDTSNSTSLSLIPFGGTVNIGNYFDKLVVDEDDAIVDPNPTQYKIFDDVDDTMFRFTNGGNCIEVQNDDYDDQKIPEASRSEVPFFWAYNFVNTPWCPSDDTAAIFSSDDVEMMHDAIDDWELSVGTGMDIGALWAVKALSPEYRGELSTDFPNRPFDYDETGNKKVLVIMTDGGITPQYRNIDITNTNGMGNNRQEIVPRGTNNTSINADNANARFRRSCETAKAAGINVFTVGYQIPAGSTTEALLQTCASDPDNYFLQTGNDLSPVFDAINSSIRNTVMTN